MYKINVPPEFKDKHKSYFFSIIIPRLKNCKNCFNRIDAHCLKHQKKKLNRMHNSFIKYCISNKERLSVGNFDEMKSIYDYIHNNMKLIEELIDNKEFKFDKSNRKYKGKKYWEIIFDAFGYDQFGDCDLYNILYEVAKKNELLLECRSNSDKNKVQNEFVRLLLLLFPELTYKINKEFENINNTTINMAEFKDKYIKFEKKNHLVLTIYNYKNIDFNGIWNSYLFVYESGLRTCPYCNRQYITPIITSNGRLRATLDHFLPKNRYPYFSMSLYNLVPSCYFCNSSLKGIRETTFDDLSPYEYSADEYMKFVYDISSDKKIHIKLLNNYNNYMTYRYINMFKLEEQYSYNTNQVKELLTKRLMYPDTLIRNLKNYLNNQKINITEDKIEEMIIGYSKDKLKINDEPLSKFRRDIVEQLKFCDSDTVMLIDQLREIINK